MPLAATLVAAAATAVAAIPLGRLSTAWGLLDHPAGRKAHRQPTPLLGGGAVLLGIAAGLGVHSLSSDGPAPSSALLGGAVAVFGVGLIDDWRSLGVGVRLAVQLLAATPYALECASGLPGALLSVPLAVLWMVGVTNATNLIDNMDGLCSGTVAIASLFLAVLAPSAAPLALAVAGSALGFLAHNRPPASQFLGDNGSLLLGFLLAGSALSAIAGDRTSLAPVALVLLVPLSDTLLVTVSRLRRGLNPLRTPGLDHLSHRLAVRLGSPQRAMAALLATSAVSGALALASRSRPWLPVVPAAAALLTLAVLEHPRLPRADAPTRGDCAP